MTDKAHFLAQHGTGRGMGTDPLTGNDLTEDSPAESFAAAHAFDHDPEQWADEDPKRAPYITHDHDAESRVARDDLGYALDVITRSCDGDDCGSIWEGAPDVDDVHIWFCPQCEAALGVDLSESLTLEYVSTLRRIS